MNDEPIRMMDWYVILEVIILVFIGLWLFDFFNFPRWSYESQPIGDKEYFKFGTDYCINQSYEKLYEIKQVKRMYADITCIRINHNNNTIEFKNFTEWIY